MHIKRDMIKRGEKTTTTTINVKYIYESTSIAQEAAAEAGTAVIVKYSKD